MSLMICDSCKNSFPADKFPDLGGAPVCEFCLTGENIEEAKKKIIAKTDQIAKSLLDATGANGNVPKLNAVISAVYKEYGGPQGYAQTFKWVMDELCSRDVVPAAAANIMLQFMKLHFQLETKDEDVDLRKMTDEQIRREQDLAMMQLVLEASGDPSKRDALGSMLQKQGYRLEKMDDLEMAQAVTEMVEAEIQIAPSRRSRS